MTTLEDAKPITYENTPYLAKSMGYGALADDMVIGDRKAKYVTHDHVRGIFVFHAYGIGAPVTYTNEFGVVFPGKRIVGIDTSMSWHKRTPRYFYEPCDAPWSPVPEDRLSPGHWLDKYIEEQKASQGKWAPVIAEWAELEERFGSDYMERLVNESKEKAARKNNG